MVSAPPLLPRLFRCILPVLRLLFIQHAYADVFTSKRTTQRLCSHLLSEGNATGSDSETIGLDQFGVNYVGQWKVSVVWKYEEQNIDNATHNATQDSPNALANVWLDPWTGVDLHYVGNPFRACAYIFKGLLQNTIRRGQEEDGTCHQTFSQACITELTKRAVTYAQWQVVSPKYGPFSNLTAPILVPICNGIFESLGSLNSHSDFPAECRPFFDNGGVGWPTADQMILTDNQTVPTNCTFDQITPGNNTYTVIGEKAPPGLTYTLNSTSPANAYDHMAQQVFPILMGLMPPANNSRESSIGSAIGYMSCLRARNITADSRVQPALPTATPVHFPLQLTQGDVAGIVIGAVVGITLLAGATWWFWRRYQTRKNNATKHLGSELDEPPGARDKHVYKLSSKYKAVAQLDGGNCAEMGLDTSRGELEKPKCTSTTRAGSSPQPRKS